MLNKTRWKKWKRKGVDFAKSERKVLKALANFSGMTQGEISRLAKMPKRTVRFAVLKLKEKKLLREFLHEDARMSSYSTSGRAVSDARFAGRFI